MNDALVARAVDRDHGGGAATPVVEVPLRAAEIAEPFLSGRGDEIDEGRVS